MLGTCRLILAILVALSHANYRILGLNPGVIAVICFYLISGYVMTGLLRQHFVGPAKILPFYFDRVLRLFPQYLMIACLTLLWFALSGTNTQFLQHIPSPIELLANLVVVPLNFYMYNGIDQFTLIPPAWSLGAEIQFYLIFPFLMLFGVRWLAFGIGMCVLVFASTGILNSDFFGYRLLPGVLVYFMLGSYLFDLKSAPKKMLYLVFSSLVVVVIAWAVLAKNNYIALPYNYETLIGAGVGICILALMSRFPVAAWDQRLGDLSYGVFLNHFLVQWVWLGVPMSLFDFFLYIALCLGLSYLTQRFVEQPALKWRKKIRGIRP